MPLACDDLSAFMGALKEMRRVDDLLTHKLNKDSNFAGAAAGPGCAAMKNALMGASDSRTSGINHCVATLGGQIQSMRDAGADARAIRGHQMTLKFMKRELDAEDTLREQSKRIVDERCSKHL